MLQGPRGAGSAGNRHAWLAFAACSLGVQRSDMMAAGQAPCGWHGGKTKTARHHGLVRTARLSRTSRDDGASRHGQGQELLPRTIKPMWRTENAGNEADSQIEPFLFPQAGKGKAALQLLANTKIINRLGERLKNPRPVHSMNFRMLSRIIFATPYTTDIVMPLTIPTVNIIAHQANRLGVAVATAA